MNDLIKNSRWISPSKKTISVYLKNATVVNILKQQIVRKCYCYPFKVYLNMFVAEFISDSHASAIGEGMQSDKIYRILVLYPPSKSMLSFICITALLIISFTHSTLSLIYSNNCECFIYL